jgi:cytochrome c-type biogenesis protein CcmH/NrfG
VAAEALTSLRTLQAHPLRRQEAFRAQDAQHEEGNETGQRQRLQGSAPLPAAAAGVVARMLLYDLVHVGVVPVTRGHAPPAIRPALQVADALPHLLRARSPLAPQPADTPRRARRFHAP